MRRALIAVAVACLALVSVSVATAQDLRPDQVAGVAAANTPNPKLDQVATEVAGHPLTAWCENSQPDWEKLYPWSTVKPDGFTTPPGWTNYTPVIYIAPEPCAALHKLIDGVSQDAWSMARGIRVLLHEATHQIGGQYGFPLNGETWEQRLYEGRTECYALSLLPKYMPAFGINPTMPSTEWVLVKHRKRVKRHHRWVWRTWSTMEEKPTTVANPLWSQVTAAAKQQHDGIGKADPAYQGNC